MISSDIINFDDKKHTYTHQNGDKFISVTTLLNRYKKPFDKHKHAQRVADREGFTKDQVLELWQEETRRACEKGSNIHKLLENYIECGEMTDNYQWLYKSYNKAVDRHIKHFKNVYSETILYNEQYRVAGMADLIYEHKDGTFTIGDFKTNKKFRFESQFNEYLLDPVSHLSNCEFNIYSLQLSLYAYMIEQLTQKKCRKCVVFYLNNDIFLTYHTNYMKSEIENILRHFRTQQLNNAV